MLAADDHWQPEARTPLLPAAWLALNPAMAWLALDVVKVILKPPCILFSSLILHIKYTELCENDFNVCA